MNEPDPSFSYTTSDGVEIPLGPEVKAKGTFQSLLYNEYPFKEIQFCRTKQYGCTSTKLIAVFYIAIMN